MEVGDQAQLPGPGSPAVPGRPARPAPRRPDDARLARAAAAGDRAAFAAIYDRHADRLHDFCLSLLRNRDEAADATQDTFALAAERLGQLPDPARLRPWLYADPRSQALRRLRDRARLDPEADMTPSVSTLCRGSGRFGQLLGGAVLGRVVRGLVDPAGPDDADPGAGEHADGMWVVVAAGDRVSVDPGRPRAGVAGVVGPQGDRGAEALVAGPAEVHGVVLAGGLGDRHDAREGGDGVGAGVGLAAVAPLGEHLGGADLTRPWQRREDLGVWVLTQVGGDRAVQVLDRGVQSAQHPDLCQHAVAAGLDLHGLGQAGWGGAQAGQELGGRPSAAVAMRGQERAHAGLAQPGGRCWSGVALQERQADGAFDVGEDDPGAGPERVQGRAELVGRGDALLDQVAAGADHGAQGPGL